MEHTEYFAAIPEEAMFKDAARGFLEAKVPLSVVRELIETDEGFDGDLWADIASQGWTATAIPEQYGGAGFSVLELGLLLEEMGRLVTPGPFFTAAVLGPFSILLGGTEGQRAEYLPGLADGSLRIALAAAEQAGGWSPARPGTTVSRGDGTSRISGEKRYVLDASGADLLLVYAGSTSGETDLYLVAADADGVGIDPDVTLDTTRRMATVTFDDAPVEARLGTGGAGAGVLDELYDVAVSLLAFEQVGGAQRCLDMSVEYAGERVQFGRAIGSFQAVKHKCADMLVSVEAARSAALYAGWALAAGDDDRKVAAALAKTRCSAAFFDVAAEAIQVHGGIGFTWEHDLHLYFKRAKTDQMLFGTPAEWRSRLAERLGL